LLLSAVLRRCRCWASVAVDQYITPAGPTAAVAVQDGTDIQKDGRTDRRTRYRYIDPAVYNDSGVNNVKMVMTNESFVRYKDNNNITAQCNTAKLTATYHHVLTQTLTEADPVIKIFIWQN